MQEREREETKKKTKKQKKEQIIANIALVSQFEREIKLEEKMSVREWFYKQEKRREETKDGQVRIQLVFRERRQGKKMRRKLISKISLAFFFILLQKWIKKEGKSSFLIFILF